MQKPLLLLLSSPHSKLTRMFKSGQLTQVLDQSSTLEVHFDYIWHHQTIGSVQVKSQLRVHEPKPVEKIARLDSSRSPIDPPRCAPLLGCKGICTVPPVPRNARAQGGLYVSLLQVPLATSEVEHGQVISGPQVFGLPGPDFVRTSEHGT